MKDVGDSNTRTGDVFVGAAFALACAVGLAGAFVGLGVSSFWLDELVTGWMVGADHDAHAAISRILIDVHPPLYYFTLFLYSQIFGASDVSLRAFSAICASSAVLIFILGSAPVFSWPGRLFAGAMATQSTFWFFQSQNARSYALALAFSAAYLALCLRLLVARGQRRPATTWSLSGLLLVGCMTHFYLGFEGVAILLALAGYLPHHRAWAAILIVLLAAEALLYMKLVIEPNAIFAVHPAWIGGGAGWMTRQGLLAARQTVDSVAILPVALCAALAAWRLRPGLAAARARAPGARKPAPPDPAMALCIGVPMLVLLAGVGATILGSPNVTDRNLLIASPFAWGLLARLYDAGPRLAFPSIRRAANIVLAAVILCLSSTVIGRTLPRNPPFREAAGWISALPACRGQAMPLVLATRPLGHMKGNWERRQIPAEMARYTHGYSRLILRERADVGVLPADLRDGLRGRLEGEGCPVLLWTTHAVRGAEIAPLTRDLLAGLGRADAIGRVAVKTFPMYRTGIDHSRTDSFTYLLYVRPPAPA